MRLGIVLWDVIVASQVGVYLVVATFLFPASVFVSSIPAPAQTFFVSDWGFKGESGNLRFLISI